MSASENEPTNVEYRDGLRIEAYQDGSGSAAVGRPHEAEESDYDSEMVFDGYEVMINGNYDDEAPNNIFEYAGQFDEVYLEPENANRLRVKGDRQQVKDFVWEIRQSLGRHVTKDQQ